jgi:tRNA(Ile)-lysidine synthase
MESKLNLIKLELEKLIQAHPAPTYLVAVSGGLDSMLLLRLLYEIGAPIRALHINYRLRQQESDQDAALVETFCFDHQIPFHQYKLTQTELETLKKSNLQAKARNLRYAFFEEISLQFPRSLICTAHHADDLIETFWLQLFRGAGMKGMAGMPQIFNDRFRPFLSFTKKELYDAAQEIELKWREDISNKSLAYRRNIWRNQLLPEIQQTIPTIFESTRLIQKYFSQQIASELDLLELTSEKLKQTQTITLKEISLLSTYQFIELFKSVNIPFHIIHRIPELFNVANGKKLIWKNISGITNSLVHFEDVLWLVLGEKNEECPYEFQIEKTQISPILFNKFELYLDTSSVKGDLKFKLLEKNDFIFPLGMTGKKAAFDVLKDHKIPAVLRTKYWGLFDDEKLLHIVGFQTDRRAIATKKSKGIQKVLIHKKT